MTGAKFVCNICGSKATFNPGGDWREAPSCQSCGSSVRARSIAYCVALGMLDKSSLPTPPLPAISRRDLRGVGLSDAKMLADGLARAFDYTNSFYHQEPLLDICRGGSAPSISSHHQGLPITAWKR